MLDGGLFCSPANSITRSVLSPIHILIIISPNNVASDTFHNIMWNRSEDVVNKTMMDIVSTLTLGF